MIVARHLSKKFNGTEAVSDISFEIKKGQTCVLLGTSGCGKTTTLKMLNRLIEPTFGDILINGENLRTKDPDLLRRGIGYVSQNNGLFPHYSVAANVAIVPKLLGWDKKTIHEQSEFVLDRLRLPFKSYAGKFPDELSGGQQQRVAIARALVADPPVLLMDEPFGALDPVTRSQIRKEFKEITQSDRKTIVLVTHDVQEAFEMGDLICLMDKGRIVQMGTARELIFAPVNDFVRDFFGRQRLQLELSSVTFGDVWDELPVSATPFAADLERKHNLWEGMEFIAANNREGLIVAGDGESREVSLSTINAAYMHIKHKK